MYNIYVYKLKHGEKFLLCPHSADNENVEDNFSAFLYQEIVQINPIYELDHVVKYSYAHWQIDGLVHKYMHEHGIENVRGGRYKSWVLSEAEREEISSAIKFFAFDLDEQKSKRDVFCKYSQMNNDITSLKNALYNHDTLMKERERYRIDRDIIHELNWLVSIIKNPVEKFLPINPRYNALMTALSNVFKQFEREIEDARDKMQNIICELVFSKPYTFFDCRVIPSEREHSNYNYENDTMIEAALKGFELAIYTLINREDETIFEINDFNVQEIRDRLFIANMESQTN
jgi:hypothetical protein